MTWTMHWKIGPVLLSVQSGKTSDNCLTMHFFLHLISRSCCILPFDTLHASALKYEFNLGSKLTFVLSSKQVLDALRTTMFILGMMSVFIGISLLAPDEPRGILI